MDKTNYLDVKIAGFFRRCLNYYIKKRTYVESSPSQDELWDEKFANSDYFIHMLDADVRIILFKDSVLCKFIYFGFEEAELTFVKRYLKKGDIFFDIGANIGLYSLCASEKIGDKGSIYSFEPTPKTYQRLIKNIELNKFGNIKPVNIGLSDKKMITDFNISNDGFDAYNSFARLKELQNGSTIKVNVQTLDSFIEENGIPGINLIKLDVEGWEKFVLEGGKELLAHDNAPVFLVEFTEDNAFTAGYYCGELFDYMLVFGYRWYSYNSFTNTLKNEKKKLHYPYENLIAIKDLNDCYSRININL